MAALEAQAASAEEEALATAIDPGEAMDAGSETKLWKNAGYLILQKAYYDLGVEAYLNGWKCASEARFAYSLNDAFRLMVFARVVDPCSKLATARKKDDYAEDFGVSEDDLYDCLGSADGFSRGLTRRLSAKCRELLGAGGGDAVYYDCTNFYFECQRADGRQERMIVRWDRGSADFVNAAIDDRLRRAEAFVRHPSRLSLGNCQDGKQYIRKIAYDPATGEVSKERSVLAIDEARVAEERRWTGYVVYVTDIPREEDMDRDFVKAEREGRRVVPEDDLGIVRIAGRRNDIEECFREMKPGLDARPVFVRTPEHIRGHLFTVYVP